MSRKSPLKRKRTSSARRKYKEYSGENRRPGEKPKNFKGAVSRFTPLLKPFVPGLTVVLIAGVIRHGADRHGAAVPRRHS